MAGYSVTFDYCVYDDAILVAVGSDFLNAQKVAALFPLAPDFLAGSAPEVRDACLLGCGKRLLVHPGKHRYIVRLLVGNDGWDQALVVKFRGEGRRFFNCSAGFHRIRLA